MNPNSCVANTPTENSLRVYNTAKETLGNTLVPVSDNREVGCAISLTVLLKEMCGVGIKETLSTAELLQELESSTLFKEVSDPTFGDVIIDATGTSSMPNTPITHGHCGVVGKKGIMSNNSYTGLWSEFYTLESWKQRYEVQGGYTSRYFRLL